MTHTAATMEAKDTMYDRNSHSRDLYGSRWSAGQRYKRE